MRFRAIALCLLALALRAQDSEIPLGLGLPTADILRDWDRGIRFTHRFLEPARSGSKEAYGLDGSNFAGLGMDFGIRAVPGLNAQVYRTSDNKTVVLALQEQVVEGGFRLAVRVERFDETLRRTPVPGGTDGISGAALQLPAEAALGRFRLLLVPTWLSRTSSSSHGLLNAGAGLRWQVAPDHALLAEYYPRPSRLGPAYRPGGSLGYRFRTRKHRFTLLATNATGTTAHQLLGGDYHGGPAPWGQWTIGFNLVRVF